jgi:type VI secretion system protein ImpB
MPDEGSVAPKERVNIVYRPATGGQQEQIELPFKTLVVADFTGQPDETRLEERECIDVNKDTFDEVMEAHNLKLEFSVPNKLVEPAEGEDPEDNLLPLSLEFHNLKDFEPDQLAVAVPELSKLMELREALKALKGPMGNVPAFRKKVQELVTDNEARDKLMKELEEAAAAEGGDEG